MGRPLFSEQFPKFPTCCHSLRMLREQQGLLLEESLHVLALF